MKKLVMIHIAAVGDGTGLEENLRYYVTAYDKEIRGILKPLGDSRDCPPSAPKSKQEAVDTTIALLKEAGIHGNLRLVGPAVCGYCGGNCTGYPKFTAEKACRGLKAAWNGDQRAEARAESRDAADFEDRSYGRD